MGWETAEETTRDEDAAHLTDGAVEIVHVHKGVLCHRQIEARVRKRERRSVGDSVRANRIGLPGMGR
jgi:hypothetical protein